MGLQKTYKEKKTFVSTADLENITLDFESSQDYLLMLGLFSNCSRSRRRAEKVDKRMVLVYTHGLFIT